MDNVIMFSSQILFIPNIHIPRLEAYCIYQFVPHKLLQGPVI